VLRSTPNFLLNRYYPILNAFKSTSGDLTALATSISTVRSACKDVSLLGSFSESHDVPRFASYTQDISLAKNVLTFSILGDGIPIVYAGQEQHYSGGEDPANREAVWLAGYNTGAPLYQHIAKLNKVRSVAGNPTADNNVVFNENGVLAVRKGDIVSVLTNAGSSGAESTVTISTSLEAGEVTDVLSCETATVDGSGSLAAKMNQGLPRVYVPSSAIADSGLC
jgi:alpha-amylase